MRFLPFLILLSAPVLHGVEIPEPENLVKALSQHKDFWVPEYVDEMAKGQQDFGRYTPVVVRELKARLKPRAGESKTGFEVLSYLLIARGIGAKNTTELIPAVSPYVTLDRFNDNRTMAAVAHALFLMGPDGKAALKATLPHCVGENSSHVIFYTAKVLGGDVQPFIPDFVKLLLINPDNMHVERSVMYALNEFGLLDDANVKALAERARTLADPERSSKYWKTISRVAIDLRPYTDDIIKANLTSPTDIEGWNYTRLLWQDPDNPRAIEYVRKQMGGTPLRLNTVAGSVRPPFIAPLRELLEEIVRGKTFTAPDVPEQQVWRQLERAEALFALATTKPALVQEFAPGLLANKSWLIRSKTIQACIRARVNTPAVRALAQDIFTEIAALKNTDPFSGSDRASDWARALLAQSPEAAALHQKELWAKLLKTQFMGFGTFAFALATTPASDDLIRAAEAQLTQKPLRADFDLCIRGLLYSWKRNTAEHIIALREYCTENSHSVIPLLFWLNSTPELAAALKPELQTLVKTTRSLGVRAQAIALLRQLEKSE